MIKSLSINKCHYKTLKIISFANDHRCRTSSCNLRLVFHFILTQIGDRGDGEQLGAVLDENYEFFPAVLESGIRESQPYKEHTSVN